MNDEEQKILHKFQLLGRRFEQTRTLDLKMNLTKFCKKYHLDPETVSRIERGLTETELSQQKK